MRVYTLEGKLLTDNKGTYAIGKNELPYAVDRNLREMHPGAKMRMYVPWYTAYGQSGTEHVPPFENVIIDLEIEE
jgi:FKBP-type peptidyl-prolyl cis-trans isomerase